MNENNLTPTSRLFLDVARMEHRQNRRLTVCAAVCVAVTVILACVLLAGCTAKMPVTASTGSAQATQKAVTLFDTSTVKIVLEGTQTIVEDKTSGSTYSYTTTRTITTQKPTLEQMQARCIARTSASTDTLKIELAGALIIVTDKIGGQVYYIDP